MCQVGFFSMEYLSCACVGEQGVPCSPTQAHDKYSFLHIAPTFEGTAERSFVGIFQVTPDGEAACQAGYAQTHGGQLIFDIVRSVFSLEVGIGGEDDFANLVVAHALNEFVDAQIFGSNAFYGRERSVEHMIETF